MPADTSRIVPGSMALEYILTATDYVLLYFLREPTVVHNSIETDRTEIYTIQF